MSNEKRQKQLTELMETQFFIEGSLDYSDCKSVECVIEAACKLLVDNFEIAMDGTYIKEIIEQACWESFFRDNPVSDDRD